jgi:hypothetical protein
VLLLIIVEMGAGLGVLHHQCRHSSTHVPLPPPSPISVTTTAPASLVTPTTIFTENLTTTITATTTTPPETPQIITLTSILTEKETETVMSTTTPPVTITATYRRNKATAMFLFVCDGADMKCRRKDGKKGGNEIW